MKWFRKIGFFLAVLLVVGNSTLVFAGEIYAYKAKKAHKGSDVTPAQAYQMLQNDPQHTFLVDVRTKAEHQLIGHPVGAYLVPVAFWTGKMERGKYSVTENTNFAADLKKRFNPKTDRLLFMCRSGARSCKAADMAMGAGWPADKLFNIMGGFEGDKSKVSGSTHSGKRIGGSWKNEGLPWTYKIDEGKAY